MHFKILEFVFVLIVLLIARFGNDGHSISWGKTDATFLGIGSCVGYAIIVPSIILAYLLGTSPSMLEYIINLLGGILFIASGASILKYKDIQIVVGCLSIILGIVFLIDFVYMCVKTRVIVT